MTVIVELTPYEMLVAAQIGVMRQVQNLKEKRLDAYGAQTDRGWQLHIEGAMGECAVAKHLGIFWNGSIGNLQDTDVGNIQVRTTAHPNGRLILHPKDDPKDFYVLVIGENGGYRIVGGIYGELGKRDEYWTDPGTGRPAYFVPRERLEVLNG